jgi:maleylacetate reductase
MGHAAAPAPFEYELLARRVVFGHGAVDRLAGEVDRIGATRVLVVAGQRRDGELRERLGGRCAGSFTDVVQHVPVETATAAREAARQLGADCLVACGGGSAIGLAKAVALERRVPIVALPTSYAGSEMTPIWGMTTAHRKQTGRDAGVAPAVVLYDPGLTLGMPARLTASSGMNAVAHCVEGLYGPGANPVTGALATDGLRRLAAGLVGSVREPADPRARAEALLGAHLAGSVLAVAGVAIHHQLCHVLGGAFGLDHADLNAVVLPHAVRFVAREVPREMATVEATLGAEPGDAAGALYDLARSLGAPASLAEIGLDASDLGVAAEAAAAQVAQRPRPAGQAELQALLEAAWAGERPAATPRPAPSGRAAMAPAELDGKGEG